MMTLLASHQYTLYCPLYEVPQCTNHEALYLPALSMLLQSCQICVITEYSDVMLIKKMTDNYYIFCIFSSCSAAVGSSLSSMSSMLQLSTSTSPTEGTVMYADDDW